ncbi:MAG: ABC transporter ATP-binding protein [Phycisphaerae bacterium]|nr:ABC transporter ATP-binding protein [Phycisphaerae bacterium]
MTEFAVEAENLGKRYLLGPSRELGGAIKSLARRALGRASESDARREFWALRDVSFQLERGEVLGIVGRNGAGKSTLLKILSRVTAPTTGVARMRGRVGSLLEVGSGFHPDLSGRENVYLNGVTMGLTRAQIASHFDEIVAFAEVESFIDTPVKHYSSGMYMRLAFSVAAHLVADVMILDEVLAVGDASFQRKCLGRMDGLTSEGRTAILVSHSMAAIRRHCSRAMWLDGGEIRAFGATEEVISAYLDTPSRLETSREVSYPLRTEAAMQVTAARLLPGAAVDHDLTEPLTFEIDLETRRPVPGAYVGLAIRDPSETIRYWTADIDSERFHNPVAGRQRLTVTCPPRLLTPGRYTAHFAVIAMGRPEPVFAMQERFIGFGVEDRGSFLASYGLLYPGMTAQESHWGAEPAPGDMQEPARTAHG